VVSCVAFFHLIRMTAAQILQVMGLAAGAALAACAPIQTADQRGPVAAAPPAYPGYALVWADEFNRDGPPDPANWTHERGFVRNQELQWYGPENARAADGLLVIEARRERVPNPDFNPSTTAQGPSDWRRSREFAAYTSASLTTRGLHSWQYGRFEMRARIDTRAGLWPAFWTLGVEGPWPHNGEIDIMEYYRGILLANVAWGGPVRWQAVWADTRTPIASFGAAWPGAFHVWRMDWDERSISLSVDGQRLNDVDLTRTINQDGTRTNPFHQPHYLLVNLAVGGAQGGDPSPTEFPARYEIDYVRVYQSLVARGAPPPLAALRRSKTRSPRAGRRRSVPVVEWGGLKH
jgi:beta-glucanase (GH16 family)